MCVALWLPDALCAPKSFTKLTMQNGMPDNVVTEICRDPDGFVWIATEGGLARYDGTKIKTFELPAINQSISSFSVSNSTLIWILSWGQIYCFDREIENFIEVKNRELLSDNIVSWLCVQNDSIVWSSDKKKLIAARVKIDTDQSGRKSVTLSKALTYDKLTGKDESIIAMTLSQSGALYLCTDKNRLLIKAADSPLFVYRSLQIPESTDGTSNVVYRIDLIDRSLWLSTLGVGVNRYFLDTGRSHNFQEKSGQNGVRISHADAYGVVKIENGVYVVATWDGYNTLSYDQNDREPISAYSSQAELGQDVESRMCSIYADKNGVLWIGTYGGGVVVKNLREHFYHQFYQQRANEINSMALDSKQHLWISNFHTGIARSTEPLSVSNKLQFKQVYVKVKSSDFNAPIFLASDHQDQIWGGTPKSTIIRFDQNSSYTEHKVEVSGNPKFSASIQCIYFDVLDRMWVGTSQGLLRYDQWGTAATSVAGLESTPIKNITQDSLGYLWLSTKDGAMKLNPANNQIKKYAQELSVNDILIDGPNKLYLAASRGFAVLEPDTTPNSQLKLYTTNDGLCNNYVACLTKGVDGQIWLASNSGISQFSPKEQVFYNHYMQGNNRSCIRSDDGVLAWGNNKSITYFDPRELKDIYDCLQSSRLKITDLQIAGRSVKVDQEVNGQVVLSRSLIHTDRIVLNSANNNFSLQVGNTLFNNISHLNQYRLLPIQSHWISLRQGDNISYAALPAGSYTLQVRGTTTGESVSPITEIEIVIQDHWINSWWSKLIMMVICICITYRVIGHFRVKYKRGLYLASLRSELNSQRTELNRERQLNKERVAFVTYASHELRTPLTLILSPVKELLSMDHLQEDIKDRLGIIDKSASSLVDIADRLLYIQKIDAKMVKIEIERFDLVKLMEYSISTFEYLAVEQQVCLTFENKISKPNLWIYGDENKLEAMLSNLVSNSFKYRCADNAQVTITLSEQTQQNINYAVITVSDNGQGISAERQETIFDSFVTDNSKPFFSTKIGLGLFIVRHIVEEHHGQITLDSIPDHGSTFTIHIPIDAFSKGSVGVDQAEVAQLEQELTKEETESSKARVKILVVEDNADILDYVCSLFEKDFEVLRAHSGEQGLDIARKALPSIVLQDVMLPNMSGIECCRQLNQDPRTSHIGVILLTAKSDEASILEGTMAGAADYMSKPFNPQILRAKVISLLRSRNVLKQMYSKSLMVNLDIKEKEMPDDDFFVRKMVNITETNLSNPDFGVDLLAQNLNMSASTLRRTIKRHTSLSVNEVIRNVRLAKAATMLLEGDYRVGEIVELVGYNDISTFRVQFTKKFGISPSKFSAEGREGDTLRDF